jgi:hypothetical protein
MGGVSARGDAMSSAPPWCVMSLDRADGFMVERWCAMLVQPKGEPRYRDYVRSDCGYTVTLPCGFEKREPTCEECISRSKKR